MGMKLYLTPELHIQAVYDFKYNVSKKDSKDQDSIQSSTTLDPGYHMGKWQNNN